jgi:hypothetical protein
MRAHKRRKGTAPHILHLGNRWRTYESTERKSEREREKE